MLAIIMKTVSEQDKVYWAPPVNDLLERFNDERTPDKNGTGK